MEFAGLGRDLLKLRDLTNFVALRTAHPGDDLAIGELLVHSFRETYEKKLPAIMTTDEREVELRDVHTRRQNGIVRVQELGFQIIGSYALIQPDSPLNDGWTENTCTLRCLAIHPRFHSLKLSEQLLHDAINVARKWRCEFMCLHVQSGAHGIAKLYEGIGFTRQTAGDKVIFGNLIEGYLLDLRANPAEQING